MKEDTDLVRDLEIKRWEEREREKERERRERTKRASVNWKHMKKQVIQAGEIHGGCKL